MPAFSQSHHNQNEDSSPGQGYPKTNFNSPNPKILSFILKSIIFLLVISFFFIFLGIAAIALLHLLVLGSYRRQSQCCQVAISQVDIDRYFPSFDYRGHIHVQECTVCLEAFRERDMCRKLLGCGHVYHAGCVDKWLVKVPNCPICRTRVRLRYV